MLAADPALGRPCGDVRPGLRRMECGQHVVFYRASTRGILVSRILHRKNAPPGGHPFDEDDEP